MERAELCDSFLEHVDHNLYPFQEEALLAWFECTGGALVSAPTGTGKTLIAEAAVYEALATGRRMYYTTPLIALTDQKFREFQAKAAAWGFDPHQVGLITGNRRENPDALVRVVVAEILLNHLIGSAEQIAGVDAVVMDEFHYFNDRERGIVWELSLVLLPPRIRLMLLSATVGNPAEFVRWIREKHRRELILVQSKERRVPLEFIWVGEKSLTEHLPEMVADDDAHNRTPALVFCFNRDECWQVAERLKGIRLITPQLRSEIEERLAEFDLSKGAGLKLRQLLLRGVGVHHAGILPKYKQFVEELFLAKLIPFVICTETLAAGVNLPARSVVLSTLLHGKPKEKKLIAASSAHQMFGRAGRPQFDTTGYVYALAHDDDVKIVKWRKRYDQIDPKSKDPGTMRMRKQLERKKPTRRRTEQYWTEGQFRTLINAGPAKLVSRSMIPYHILIYLLTRTGTLRDVRAFLASRFNTPQRVAKFQNQLDYMIANLARFGFLQSDESGDHVTLAEDIDELLTFRSIDPLYGRFLAAQLIPADFSEKLQALESVLPVPPAMARRLCLPELPQGPMERETLAPALLQMGIGLTHPDGGIMAVPDEAEGEDYWEDKPRQQRLTMPEMLKALFDAKLASPEPVVVQPQWIVGAVLDHDEDFYKFVRLQDLTKNEGVILRHVLRMVILAGEFHTVSKGDPDYARVAELATRICQQVDARYTDRFLAADAEARRLATL